MSEPRNLGQEPLLISAAEAARLLNVCERTVVNYSKSGLVPHVRIGRRRLFSVESLRRWIAERERSEGEYEPR